jgi:sugar phosphate isomerase/epimerase
MKPQNYEKLNQVVRARFEKRRKAGIGKERLNLSWSNWGFGIEPLAVSVKRLAKYGVRFIELHGNHYGTDLGYRSHETLQILDDHGVRCAGICGMFSTDNDLSSNRGVVRQRAIDYLKRTLDFASEVGAGYILTVPGAVGRPQPCDHSEWERSAATLRLVADLFGERRIRSSIEPIRSAEVSLCHTIADAKRYIRMVGHPAIRHINGDVYHMQVEEAHIGTALLEAGSQLTNLHMADSNRCALGMGSMDLDTILRALYAIGYNQPGCYCTPEPLGPGGDPYPAMHGKPNPALLDRMVQQTARYFREREAAILNG